MISLHVLVVSIWNLSPIGTWLEDAMLMGAMLLSLASTICIILLLIFAMSLLLVNIKSLRRKQR